MEWFFSKKSTTLKMLMQLSMQTEKNKRSCLTNKGCATEMVFSAVNFNKDFDYCFSENGARQQMRLLTW
jgi:hypothetical protein